MFIRKKAMLWEKLEGKKIHCFLCANRCDLDEGHFGFCGVRQNVDGELNTYAYGKVIAANIDPIEKKPLYHFFPGTSSYSIATIGCNFRCSFCQNWTISQTSAKDGNTTDYETAIERSQKMTPEDIVAEAIRSECKSISYTYTEPTIFFEYAYDTAKTAKERGLCNVFVTNGFMTKEAIAQISPYLDAANIDLKFFNDDSYRTICNGRLQPVMDSIRNMKKAGIWVEVTTLIIPGKNDSDSELRNIAAYLAGIGKDIPWHISRFHPDYKYMGSTTTPVDSLERAVKIGKKEGLKYIYLGNVYSRGETVCPDCGTVAVERSDFAGNVSEGFLEQGKCTKCGNQIEGVWK